MVKNILLADCQYLIQLGLGTLIRENLGYQHVHYANNCSKIVTQLLRIPFSHLILDHSISRTMLSVVEAIATQYPDLLIMIYAAGETTIYQNAYRRYGIHDVLFKNQSEADTALAVGRFLHKTKKSSPPPDKPEKTPFSSLTPREIQVLTLLLDGLSVTDISIELGISMSTVSTWKGNIFQKTSTLNFRELIDLANIYDFHPPIPSMPVSL